MRAWSHLRANAVAYVALLVALSGSAHAINGSLPGKNTVGSADIMNGEVTSPDVGTDRIRSGDVRDDDLIAGGLVSEDIADGALQRSDLAEGSFGGRSFLDGTLFGVDLLDGGITGGDVNESSLVKVPSTRAADSAGTGGYAFRYNQYGDVHCDPESGEFLECVSLDPLTLPAPGRVLIIATAAAETEYGADEALGACRLVVNGNPYLTSTANFDEDDPGDGVLVPSSDHTRDDATLVAVTDPLPAGDNSVALECNEGSAGAVWFHTTRISTMTLSSG